MGRLVKNPDLTNAIARGVVMPIGSSASRSSDPATGSFRYNTSTQKLEVWNSTEWRTIGTEGVVTITKDTFTGDGSSIQFGAMSFAKAAGTEATVQVYVGNVHQNPGVAYTFDGTTNITFTSPPPDTHTIVILYGFDSTVAE
jgi:hypothetical protein